MKEYVVKVKTVFETTVFETSEERAKIKALELDWDEFEDFNAEVSEIEEIYAEE